MESQEQKDQLPVNRTTNTVKCQKRGQLAPLLSKFTEEEKKQIEDAPETGCTVDGKHGDVKATVKRRMVFD
ncbi:hypothetical protein UPYG_G00179940 [Umbra pygmaea]|uniref:Uncharacterized protein n=1 Tax=Umbra pygmaea TaxID=75934 RepID=A0ABD0WV84_UMBPY